MKPRLYLTRASINDLAAIAEIGPDKLKQVVGRLSQPPGGTLLKVGELRAVLEDVLPGPQAQAILRQVITLLTTSRRQHYTESGIPEAVTEALRRQATAWSPGQFADWERVEPVFGTLLGVEAVSTVAKALDLSFDYANWLDGVRIITDVRPVYNKAHDDIIGAVISQVLRLEYTSDDGPHTVSIALSEQDVEEICRVCREAKAKADRAQVLAKDRWKLKAFVSGSENYDPD